MAARTQEELEAQIKEFQAKRTKNQETTVSEEKIDFGSTGHFDKDIYGGNKKYEGYLTSIAPTDPDEDEEEYSVSKGPKSITATADVLKDFQGNGDVC
jgi:hypothetical protein